MSRIAFLSPLPPQPTGIADYSARVLGALAGRVDIDVYCAYRPVDPIPGIRVRRVTGRGLRRLDSYDGVVAQVGNSVAHDWIVDWIRQRPSTVVLHELVLHHLVGAMTLGRGNALEYMQLLRDEAGDDAVRRATRSLAGLEPPLWETQADRYPMTGVVARHASGLIVHSRYMAGVLAAGGIGVPIDVAPFPVTTVPKVTSAVAAAPGHLTLGVFGFITPNKRLSVVLRAMHLIASRVPGVRLLIVGGSPSGLDARELALQIGVDSSRVEVHGYSDQRRYEELAARVDLGISLRHPTFGETSAATLDFMVRGIPVVVSTGGWYDELPDDAVARIAPDADEALRLAATIEHLAMDIPRRTAMGAAAGEYARSELAPSRTADAYIRAVLGEAGRPELEAILARSVAQSIASVTSVSGGPTSPLSQAVGAAARQLGLLSAPR